ncbi:porin family protein [Thiotrichales bacterium 19S3-7]|nr:porin family protein [Thiotrichales bacterium 19S3-7]MCF6802204.1 porin family protein [Thiotrichales bacterium 19S3-11]
MKFKRIIAICISIGFVLLPLKNASALILGGGPYVDINGGYAFSDSLTVQNAVNQKDNGYGFSVNAGWMIVPLVGIEAGYTKYPDVKYRYNGNDQTASLYGYDIAVKGQAPLVYGFSLIGKVGIGRLNQGSLEFSGNTISSQKGNNLFWAVGLKYELVYGFYSQLIYQVNQSSSNIPTSSMLTLGIGYQL